MYPMLAGIYALPHVRKQGSPQSHEATEQKSQVIDLIFFSVSPFLCGDSLLQIAIKDTNFHERMVYRQRLGDRDTSRWIHGKQGFPPQISKENHERSKHSGVSRGRLIKHRARRRVRFFYAATTQITAPRRNFRQAADKSPVRSRHCIQRRMPWR